MNKTNILTIIMIILLGLIGIIPFYITLTFIELLITPMFLFTGIGSYCGFYFFSKGIQKISLDIFTYVISVLIVILACIVGECLLSYSTLLSQFHEMGIREYSYFNIMGEVPLNHLLGYYFGIDLLNVNDSSIIFETVLKMWSNLILSVIFALTGVLISKFCINFIVKLKNHKTA